MITSITELKNLQEEEKKSILDEDILEDESDDEADEDILEDESDDEADEDILENESDDEADEDILENESDDETDEKENSAKNKENEIMSQEILIIKKYLDEFAEKDEFFKTKYNSEEINDCFSYITEQIKEKYYKGGNCVMVDEVTVYKMARDFYLDDVMAKKRQEQAEKKAREEAKKAEDEKWKKIREDFNNRPSIHTEIKETKAEQLSLF